MTFTVAVVMGNLPQTEQLDRMKGQNNSALAQSNKPGPKLQHLTQEMVN